MIFRRSQQKRGRGFKKLFFTVIKCVLNGLLWVYRDQFDQIRQNTATLQKIQIFGKF